MDVSVHLREMNSSTGQTDSQSVTEQWRRTARSRLRFELAGLAFALQKGFTGGDYGRHLWSEGAVRWMGKVAPRAGEYLLKEAEAFRRLYPEVIFEIIEAGEEKAELVFTRGCLGGWGKDPWALASSLKLAKKDICHYCHASFRVWAEQLGLSARIGPGEDGHCRLRVHKEG